MFAGRTMSIECINIIQVLVIGKAKPAAIYLNPETFDPTHIILYPESDLPRLAQYRAFTDTDGCDDRRLYILYQPELPKFPEAA